MKRKLGKSESALAYSDAHFPLNLVGILFLEGVPDPEILRKALDLLQNRHPFLRVRMTEKRGNYFFEDGDIPQIPLKIIERLGENHWQEVAEKALNSRLDRTQGPLCAATFLHAGQAGEIILSFHHSIIDGESLSCLFDELLTICARFMKGDKVAENRPLKPVAPGEASYPPEFRGIPLILKAIPFLARQMTDEITYRLRTLGGRKPVISESARNCILALKIPADITLALTQSLRKKGITLNSAINAAMLLAVNEQPGQSRGPLLRYMSMGSLRPYLDPPASPNELGCFVSMMRFTIEIGKTENFWALARDIHDQIYTAARRGDRFITPLLSKQILRLSFALRNFRLATTALSYTGSSRLEPAYGPIRLRRARGFISNNGLGPELTAHVSLFNDELCWDFLYLASDMDAIGAQQIADRIYQILENASA